MKRRTQSKRVEPVRKGGTGRAKSGEQWLLIAGLGILIVGLFYVSVSRLSAPAATPAPTPTTSAAAGTAAALGGSAGDQVQRITAAEAKTLLDQGKGLLVDVRLVDSYNVRHAEGAISMPEDEMSARLGELPKDKVLVFYCT